MRTDYELAVALRAMYLFLGGDGCAQCSSRGPNPHFRCGFNSSNKVLIDAILKAASMQDKTVKCVYAGAIANIEVIF